VKYRHVVGLLPWLLLSAGCSSMDWWVAVEGGYQPPIAQAGPPRPDGPPAIGDGNPYVRVTGVLRPQH